MKAASAMNGNLLMSMFVVMPGWVVGAVDFLSMLLEVNLSSKVSNSLVL